MAKGKNYYYFIIIDEWVGERQNDINGWLEGLMKKKKTLSETRSRLKWS